VHCLTFVLITALFSLTKQDTMKAELMAFREFTDYPSGSGIEWYNGRLYLIGDDAGDLLVMDSTWTNARRIKLFDTQGKRIPKTVKSDLEAMAFILVDKQPHLLITGSGSEQRRNQAILFNLQTEKKSLINMAPFYERLKKAGIADLNIEGIALAGNRFLLSHRGNKTHPDNYLIATTSNFFRQQETAPFIISRVKLPHSVGVTGISGLAYSGKSGKLIITASTEDTPNAIDDGEIGKSYVIAVDNFFSENNSNGNALRVDEKKMLDLDEIDKKFNGYKIESVCIESENKECMILHLVADNDTGKSYLFKVKLHY
jgi:hypothetical protein